MKRIIFLLLILSLAITLRLYRLGENPVGFYSDEAAFAYNSYSLMQTKRDEYGSFLPVVLKSFGDYKAALYSYYLIPFIFIGDLSVFSVRAGSALLGLGQIFLTYAIVVELFKSKKLALLSGLFMSMTPIVLQFNRMLHENNLSSLLIAAGLYFFIKSRQQSVFLIPATFFSTLSFYAYHDARVITPLIVLFFILYWRKAIFKKKGITALCVVMALFMLIPLVVITQKKEVWTRPQHTSLMTDYGMILTINQERGESGGTIASRMLHNKLTIYTRQFLENYFKHFDMSYLFFRGDPVQIYSTVGNGILFIVELPLLIIGLYSLYRRKTQSWLLIIFWLIVSPFAGALTRFVPSASRTLSVVFPLSIIAAAGLLTAVRFTGKTVIAAFLISLMLFVNFGYYLHYYHFNTGVRFAKEWHYGMREVINQVIAREKEYDSVWFSRRAWGYLYPLFFMKFPPAKFQTQAKLGPLDEYGFGWISGFDKYIFERIPKYFDLNRNILYVLSPEDIRFKVKELARISYPDGTDAYYLIDTSVIKAACPSECNIAVKPDNEDIFGNIISK